MIKPAMVVGFELVLLLAIVAEKILAPIDMAKPKKYVLVTNLLKIRASGVIVPSRKWGILREKSTQGFPVHQVF